MTGRRSLATAALVLAALGATAGGTALLVRPGTPAPAAARPSAVDVGFAQDMAVHHQQAVLMSQLVDDDAQDPAVQALARSVVVGQSEQRGTLTGWLALWHAPGLSSGPMMSWATGHALHGDDRMGMASQPELDRLAGARAGAREGLYLQLLLRHHQGALLMAQEASVRAALPEVRSLAAVMVQEEQEESVRMRLLLRQRRLPVLPV